MERAFTLVELLVVVAIIAVLAAVLFPVFATAKVAAKKTQSLTQLRQTTLAWSLYNDDYDGTVMRALTTAPGKVVYWWGSFDGTELRPEEGLLYPYMRENRVFVDPTFPVGFRSAIGLTGYGYNYAYLSPSEYVARDYHEVPVPVAESRVERPAETLVFASAARINNWDFPTPKLEGNTFIDPPSYNFPSVHGRANRQAVVSWADGHATTLRPSLRTADFGYGNEAALFAQANLGDAIKAGCPVGSACQDYYYSLAKD
ncbi:MAG: type II secretion system protein [Fimbriimonadaceae bacterium]|nr:type II secretion system protein [Fimbriimonadaceae bacterium]